MCGTVDFTTAFARLLVAPALRRTYRHKPAAVARQLAVAESQRKAFCNLDPDNLERQAAGLISKRRYEVAQRRPRIQASRPLTTGRPSSSNQAGGRASRGGVSRACRSDCPQDRTW